MAKSKVNQSEAVKVKVASVLSFERKLVSSAGYFYGTNWNDRATETLLPLSEISVRGVIANRQKGKYNQAKFEADAQKANLQTVDTCSLGKEQDTLKVSFTLKVLNGVEQPSSCNSEAFQQTYQEAVKQYIEEYGFRELAKRYAQNIASGRFLWRNRSNAEQVEVQVKINGGEPLKFNGFAYDQHDFSKDYPELEPLIVTIEKALSSETESSLLTIDAYALIGEGQPVFPSEELVLNKDTSKFKKSKILYETDGTAALHSQKISNAIRTIDTWYPDFAEKNMAIAVEPYGTVTNFNLVMRNPQHKQDFYTLFDKFAVGGELESAEQKHYVMAVLIRGGVFGQGKDA